MKTRSSWSLRDAATTNMHYLFNSNSSLSQGLALALSVPVFVVVTKIDMCPGNVLQETLKLLVRILRSPGCRKYPVMVKSKDDVVLSATKFVSERLCPIFQVSNVTGENLDLLTMFMNLLSNRTPNTDDEPSEFQGGLLLCWEFFEDLVDFD